MTKARNIANLASDGSALADGTINYTDVSGTPTLATVATSGSFNDLSNQPAAFDPNTLATVAVSGAYADVTGTPTLAAVATTGAYADVTGTPAAALPLTGGTLSGGLSVTGTVAATAVTGDGSGLTGVSPPTTYGAVGTYVTAMRNLPISTSYAGGTTVAGSVLLKWQDTGQGNSGFPLKSDSTNVNDTAASGLSGTWRLMAPMQSSGNSIKVIGGLYVRIS
jgi:hypothetical protein